MALTLGIMAVAQEWQSTPFRSPAICPEPSELRYVIPRVADSGRNAGLLGGAVSFRVLGIRVRSSGRFAFVAVWPPVPPPTESGRHPVSRLCSWLTAGGVTAQFILTTRTPPSHPFSPAPYRPHLLRKREAFFFLIN